MSRGNCCNICTPPPDSCILGACCYDDGDNVDITCEENVTESYCLVKPNSVFNARGVCGEKITCDSYYEPKISKLGLHSYVVIKSDGSVVTWKTKEENNSSFHAEEKMLLSSEDALRIQPVPFGDNGATRIYSNNSIFCAVRKKDGSFVVWGKYLDSSEATVIEEGIKNAKKIVLNSTSGCALKEDGSIFTFYFFYQSTSSNFGQNIPPNLSALISDSSNPVVDIFSGTLQFCALLKNGDSYIWGYLFNHLYDIDSDGRVSTNDQLIMKSNLGFYDSKYDLNQNGSVTPLDEIQLAEYIGLYGASSDALTEGVQKPITNVSGVFSGAGEFHFIKNNGSFYSRLNPGSKQSQLTNVSGVFFTDRAACALQHDGTVVAWGDSDYGGFIDPVLQQKLDDEPYVKQIASTDRAFAAVIDIDQRGGLSSTHSSKSALVTWGSSFYGGDSSIIYTGDIFNDPVTTSDQTFNSVRSVFGSRRSFLLGESKTHWGGVKYWDSDPYGNERFHDTTFFNSNPSGVVSNTNAISVLTTDNKVYSFGAIANGGYGTTDRYDETKNTPVRRFKFNKIISNENSFAGLSQEGGIVCWGNASYTQIGLQTIGSHVEQDFIDEQLKKIGANVNLHGNLITAGYEGCTSSSAQKDFCKTEDKIRLDCNPHTGHCDYGLGDFYPFIKVDNCKQCEEIANDKSYNANDYRNLNLFTRDGVLVPNFQPTTEVTCFYKGIKNGVVHPDTYGQSFLLTNKITCDNLQNGLGGIAVSGDSTYYSKFPTPILGVDVGTGPSGSCCFGLICEEGYNEYKHHPNSEQCRDFKICYEVLTEAQCYKQKFTLFTGGGAEITYKTYHDFVENKTCADRTGEEGCQP